MLIEHWEAIDLVAHSLFKHKRLSYQDLKVLLTTKSRNRKFWKETFKEIDQIFPE